MILAALGYLYIADWPEKAKFLTEKERAFVLTRLRVDSDSTNNEGFSWHNVGVALRDPKVWLYGLGYHTLSLPLYTLSLFLVCHVLLYCIMLTSSSRPLSRHLDIPPPMLSS